MAEMQSAILLVGVSSVFVSVVYVAASAIALLHHVTGQHMKTVTGLTKTLRLHEMWLRGEKGGAWANLAEANLTSANLTDANLNGADLRGARLNGANVAVANMTDANLRRATLIRVTLIRANLTGANLTGANLTEANLRRAHLRGANLRGSDLHGTNLACVKGVLWADCSWSSHGEIGRRLLGVVIDGVPKYFCGCFSGSLDDLRQYIADGDESTRASRTLAADFVSARLEEMLASDHSK